MDVDVLGWKNVNVMVGVDVMVGEGVPLGVSVMVPVRMGGVPLNVAMPGVPVPVMVGVGVTSRGLGAKERQMNPAQ